MKKAKGIVGALLFSLLLCIIVLQPLPAQGMEGFFKKEHQVLLDRNLGTWWRDVDLVFYKKGTMYNAGLYREDSDTIEVTEGYSYSQTMEIIVHELVHYHQLRHLKDSFDDDEEYGADTYGIEIAMKIGKRLNYGREADLVAWFFLKLIGVNIVVPVNIELNRRYMRMFLQLPWQE